MAKRTTNGVGSDRGSVLKNTLSPMNSGPMKGDSWPDNNNYGGKKSLPEPKDPLGLISGLERKSKK